MPARATLNGPKGVRCDGEGNLLIADCENHAIRKVDFKNKRIFTVAGGRRGSGGDGQAATLAELNRPHGCIALADGSLIVCDSENNRVRKVGP